jgi:hypothetical protein
LEAEWGRLLMLKFPVLPVVWKEGKPYPG